MPYHNKTMLMPRIDEIAKAGVILEGYYVQPICSPTRSSLMVQIFQLVETILNYRAEYAWRAVLVDWSVHLPPGNSSYRDPRRCAVRGAIK